jgi:hypothetical protein
MKRELSAASIVSSVASVVSADLTRCQKKSLDLTTLSEYQTALQALYNAEGPHRLLDPPPLFAPAPAPWQPLPPAVTRAAPSQVCMYVCVYVRRYVCIICEDKGEGAWRLSRQNIKRISSYYYTRVLMLLHMCSHTTTYVPSYYDTRVLILLHCVLMLLHVSSYYYINSQRGSDRAALGKTSNASPPALPLPMHLELFSPHRHAHAHTHTHTHRQDNEGANQPQSPHKNSACGEGQSCNAKNTYKNT